MLREKIDAALKSAMKARDEKVRVATLRLINAAIKDRDIAARGEDRCEGVSDDEILTILAKMVKQREDSSEAFEKGARPDLAEQEKAEIDVIRDFMPRQLTDAEIERAVDVVIKELGATSLKDMGRSMAALKERYAGANGFRPRRRARKNAAWRSDPPHSRDKLRRVEVGENARLGGARITPLSVFGC
ncbi:MAG: GatB/YqeY domain-containing protein [Rhodospirillales bacterium]|nr:GatB/YqeY domain-containing protein [Rhodospirillales bacterium]